MRGSKRNPVPAHLPTWNPFGGGCEFPPRSSMPSDKKSKSRSARAGVIFPVGRIHRHLKEGRYAERISSDAPVFMAAVLQQVVEEVFKEAETRKDKASTKRLVPNNILTAIRKDRELNDIFKDIVIREGGVPRGESSRSKKDE